LKFRVWFLFSGLTVYRGPRLSDSGRIIRLNRILRGDRHKALVVAFDHALVLGPIPGTEDPVSQIQRFAVGGADAILLNLGLMQDCIASLASAPLPGIIARIDWTTGWCASGNSDDGELRGCLLARPADALRQGADAVLTYLVVGTGDTDFEAKEIERNAEVARECERIGMPLIVETLARGKQVSNPRDSKWLSLHTRMAVELGASMVKTDYAGDPESMRRIVDGCPVPILVLGGSRYASDEQALDVIRGAMAGGAAGVLFGRNVFQADDIVSFLHKVRAALDGGVQVAQ
jgi:DhnA family fructose-bisphosphate aldolase class Ia